MLAGHRQGESNDFKSVTFTQNLGSETKFPFLGILVSTPGFCLSLCLDDDKKALVNSLEAHRKMGSLDTEKTELSFVSNSL